MSKPIPHRHLKAEMILRGLTLRQLSTLARVDYTRACEVLNGTRIAPATLEKLRRKIMAQPLCQEVPA